MSTHELVEALAEGRSAGTAMWDAFWDGQRMDGWPQRREQAQALANAMGTKLPDASSLAALVDSLELRRERPAPQGAVNIVGTGGGPSTFNISTAAALVGGALGVRVAKSGSRAYTSRYGSIDVLELLGIPLADSYAASAAALEEFGIAFVGSFVYPPELKLLLSSVAPPQRRALGRLFNRIGPFLAALESSCQLTGVSEQSALPLLELLASRRSHRVWLCFNSSGVDELLAFEENVIRTSDADELRIPAGSLAPASGSLADLRPAEGPEACVRQLTGLLVGDGPPAAVATIALNAAALLVASGLCSDWGESYAAATRAIERGHAVALLERLRGGRTGRSRRYGAAPAVFERASHSGRPGLALFLNAGDPPFATMRRLLLMLDAQGVDCVELAVPFDNTITDGPVIRRSAARALRAGVDLSSTLAFIAALRPQLSRLKIVLMADWRHTVRAVGIERFLEGGQRAGCDGVLLHGVPPRFRSGYYERARQAGLPIVATCFTSSSPAMMQEAAENAGAYLYLVAHYGRGEGAGHPQREQLAPKVSALRRLTSAPIAVGFGVRSAADVRAVADAGADAAIVGGACVACVERALQSGRDPVVALRELLGTLALASPAEHLRLSARG